MTSIADYRRALVSVPTILLSTDDQRILADARTSLDVLERIDVVPRAIVYVGSSGSGKSTIVNATIGGDVAAVGVERPTTHCTTMYGSSGPVSLAARSEYVHVSSMRPGLVIVDTPPFEHDPDAVRSAVAVADLVVVVVSPSRYADATMRELVESIPSQRPAVVLLNRISASGEDRHALIASVRERYGNEVVELDESGDIASAVTRLLDVIDVDTDGYERSAVLRSAAAAAGRYVARAVGAASSDVAQLADAIESLDPVSLPVTNTVLEEWSATRDELIVHVIEARRSVDDRVMTAVRSEIAERVATSLVPWEKEELSTALDRWRERTVDRFVDAARIRWRRAAAIALLDRFAWRTALNPDVELPARVRRVMGTRLVATRVDAASDVAVVLEQAIDRRVGEWRRAVESLATYAPGALLGAADDFAPDLP